MRPESLYFLFSPVTRLKGIGSETAKALARLLPAATARDGRAQPIIRDLLFHLPVGIVDRRFTCPLNQAPNGKVATFVVTVDEHKPPRRGSKSPYKVLCSNETGDITLIFFHAREDYLKNALPVGKKRVISGRVEIFDYVAQMPHPDVIAPVEQLADVQKPDPIYPLTVGLTSRRISKIVNDALEKLPELVISSPLQGEGISWKSALTQAHHPQTEEDLLPTSPARTRLAYDEMLARQLHLALLRRNLQKQKGEVIKGTGELTEPLIKSLPFALTNGQQQVLFEISEDMVSGHRMTRLLQGDVGSGKTIVALLAMLKAAEEGRQSALMAPTELIAQQHFRVIESFLRVTYPVSRVTLLTGSVKGAGRKEALEKIRSGEAKIVIGTHALFQEKVEFHDLALVVVDEQHRFGVEQRMALSHKGNAPHILHMSATPIPRSLAMTLYGDMDISQLTEKPANRQKITTALIPNSRYNEIMERMKAALDRGEKVYWICPLIDDNPALVAGSGAYHDWTPPFGGVDDLAAAKSRHAEFKARFGPVVGLVHGRMKVDQRHEEMRKFASGKTRLLVATTVVEVGVDVKDATIMVIEQAERFGLAQLHQLRGRVGRGEKASACVLLYSDDGLPMTDDKDSDPSSVICHRLSVLRETDDGFKIAEADLAQRGGGELLGTRQSGLPRFIFTDLAVHQKLMETARDEAKMLLKEDPELQSPRGQATKLLLDIFGYEH